MIPEQRVATSVVLVTRKLLRNEIHLSYAAPKTDVRGLFAKMIKFSSIFKCPRAELGIFSVRSINLVSVCDCSINMQEPEAKSKRNVVVECTHSSWCKYIVSMAKKY